MLTCRCSSIGALSNVAPLARVENLHNPITALTRFRFKHVIKYLHESLLTPSQQVIPHEVLLFCEHSHDDQRVQVDPLTKHPEVVTAQQVQVDERQQLAARLDGKKEAT